MDMRWLLVVKLFPFQKQFWAEVKIKENLIYKIHFIFYFFSTIDKGAAQDHGQLLNIIN